jgi:hypothetical protein
MAEWENEMGEVGRRESIDPPSSVDEVQEMTDFATATSRKNRTSLFNSSANISKQITASKLSSIMNNPGQESKQKGHCIDHFTGGRRVSERLNLSDWLSCSSPLVCVAVEVCCSSISLGMLCCVLSSQKMLSNKTILTNPPLPDEKEKHYLPLRWSIVNVVSLFETKSLFFPNQNDIK